MSLRCIECQSCDRHRRTMEKVYRRRRREYRPNPARPAIEWLEYWRGQAVNDLVGFRSLYAIDEAPVFAVMLRDRRTLFIAEHESLLGMDPDARHAKFVAKREARKVVVQSAPTRPPAFSGISPHAHRVTRRVLEVIGIDVFIPLESVRYYGGAA